MFSCYLEVCFTFSWTLIKPKTGASSELNVLIVCRCNALAGKEMGVYPCALEYTDSQKEL